MSKSDKHGKYGNMLIMWTAIAVGGMYVSAFLLPALTPVFWLSGVAWYPLVASGKADDIAEWLDEHEEQIDKWVIQHGLPKAINLAINAAAEALGIDIGGHNKNNR